MSGKRCLVIGAGIVGAAIAWNLQRAGAQVRVLDAGEPGGLATRHSWAWINASWGNPEPYFRLREHSMLEWRKIDRDVPGLRVNWCGGLIWDLEPEALEAYAVEQSAWGYGIRRVGPAEAQAIEPNLRSYPALALHVAEEGVVEPLATAQVMLAGAAALGAEMVPRMRVKWLIEQDGRIAGAMTDEGPMHADETIIAAGAGCGKLLETVGITLNLTAPAGLLSHSKPVGEVLHGLVMTPGLHVRQTAEGRLVAGTDFAGADPLDAPEAMARDLHAKVQAMIKGAEGVELDFHTVGYRPTPADGFPAIGRPRQREGLYVAVTHSGITLAPIVGLFAAQELLDGQRDPLLEPYAPDRPPLT
jgi:glycine/D-amino acid oxidase-like deaminating enzyme